jgi:hypothetical protein
LLTEKSKRRLTAPFRFPIFDQEKGQGLRLFRSSKALWYLGPPFAHFSIIEQGKSGHWLQFSRPLSSTQHWRISQSEDQCRERSPWHPGQRITSGLISRFLSSLNSREILSAKAGSLDALKISHSEQYRPQQAISSQAILLTSFLETWAYQLIINHEIFSGARRPSSKIHYIKAMADGWIWFSPHTLSAVRSAFKLFQG